MLLLLVVFYNFKKAYHLWEGPFIAPLGAGSFTVIQMHLNGQKKVDNLPVYFELYYILYYYTIYIYNCYI